MRDVNAPSLHPTGPVDQEAQNFLIEELEYCFHIDENMLELLDMPSDQDPVWVKLVDDVSDEFGRDQNMCSKVTLLQTIDHSTQEAEENGSGISPKEDMQTLEPSRDILNWVGAKVELETVEYIREWLAPATHGPTRDIASGNYNRKPDLVLIERAAVTSGNKHPHWRQVSATVKLQSHRSDGPSANYLLKDSVLQTLEHMRMHLCSRPFLRWVFGLLICGTDFYVLYLDRAGGTITPRMNIIDDSRLFLKIVLHMTKMTRPQLGEDPDIVYGKHTKLIDKYHRDHQDTHPWDDKFPVYTFPAFCGGDRIRIVEEPLFITHRLLGRGTSVWRVHSSDGTEQIMKYSWRNAARQSESEIYEGIQTVFPNGVPGLCEFVVGGDAIWSADFLCTELSQLAGPAINSRRSHLIPSLPRDQDRIVHKLLLKTSGRPLSEFKDSSHLVKILISALDAHKKLVGVGILHRDISAGNILIGEDQEHPGILADVELAEALPGHHPKLSNLLPYVNDPARRPQVTCTANFASYQLLTAIYQDTTGIFIPLVRHDLEGFYWVTLWAMLIRIADYNDSSILDRTPKQEKQWRDSTKRRHTIFYQLFSLRDIGNILNARYSLMGSPSSHPDLLFPQGCVTDSEFEAFRCIYIRLRDLFKPVIENNQDVTHEQVVCALDPRMASHLASSLETYAIPRRPYS